MRAIIVSLLLVATIKSSAQIDIICTKLADSTLNYFYIGVDNPITIKGIHPMLCYKISCSGGAAVMTPLGGSRFNVSVSKVTDECRITIHGGTGKVFEKAFKVRAVPGKLPSWLNTND